MYYITNEDNFSSKCVNTQIEIREIQYTEIDDLMNIINSGMNFQIGVQNFKGDSDGDWGYTKRTSATFK